MAAKDANNQPFLRFIQHWKQPRLQTPMYLLWVDLARQFSTYSNIAFLICMETEKRFRGSTGRTLNSKAHDEEINLLADDRGTPSVDIRLRKEMGYKSSESLAFLPKNTGHQSSIFE